MMKTDQPTNTFLPSFCPHRSAILPPEYRGVTVAPVSMTLIRHGDRQTAQRTWNRTGEASILPFFNRRLG